MKITIQITVESNDGQLNVAQEVAHLDRGTLRPETLGLTLAEARSILAGIEQTVESISKRGLRGLLLNLGLLFSLHSRVPTNEGLPELVIEYLRPHLE
jgi:hypothetical protein